jgi:chloramphenicol-sensitive protein RarD
MNKGVMYALGSYILWGFLPIYMKSLTGVLPLEILSHRVAWSLLLLALALTISWRWAWLREALSDRRTVITFAFTAFLLSLNWLTYIWSVVHDHIVDGTLGYFMNPLVNVLLGVIFLRERLRPGQTVAIGVATLGVVYMAVNAGVLPWVGLTLAFSFSGYALLRKVAHLDSLKGLTLETLFLAIPSVSYLAYLTTTGGAHFGVSGLRTTLLLAGSGVITAVPLLLFAAGARRISLSTLGILQYTSPTIQFLIAVYLYGEAFHFVRIIGFSLIWLALLIYSLEGLLERQRRSALQYASQNS